MEIASFSFVFLVCLVLAVSVHGQQQSDPGFISIDCGIPDDFSYTDDSTSIPYSSDGNSIDTGTNMNISSVFKTVTLQNPLLNVRSFPQGIRNCYTLRPEAGKGNNYLIRASFMYGNYDGKNKPPEFDLYLGVNIWDTVKLDNASQIQVKEIIHVPSMDYIHVCLVNTNAGTPFISVLELRTLNNTSYRTKSDSLVLYNRLDIGSMNNKTVRYKDDVYDRIWLPHSFPPWVPFSTLFAIDSSSDNGYKPGLTVMRTAVRPLNESDSLTFFWTSADTTSKFFIYMHFAELENLRGNQFREFNVSVNGDFFFGPIVPNYLSTTTLFSKVSLSGAQFQFSIYKTNRSTLPPILNAMEIYMDKELPQSPTNQVDVDAIMNVKSKYAVKRNWQGDPCTPKAYSWDGLNCSYNGYDPPSITSLELASSGLSGEIATSLANLTSLQYLDLSNNSLTGPVPDFLSQFSFLRVLNLSGNQFTGSVPLDLIEKSKNGALLLSLDNNRNLCESDSCKKKKKVVIPIVASVTSSLVLLTVLGIILWSLKRRRQQAELIVHASEEERSFGLANRQFTYSEIVNITNNFQKVIGKGGFGKVYHGCLKDETEVAVKMLSPTSTQGSKEFRAEAQVLMRVHHRNLASLVGYCDEGTNKGLVYEYMANGNLQEHLSEKNANVLSWEERLRIAIDAAQGLEYMHNGCRPPIIHRDVKSANILLNERMQAKIADFGLSRVLPIEGLTNISNTLVAGTPGYLDPEYYVTTKLNEKSDVYSFGIVLLELITGQPVILRKSETTHIAQWVTPIIATGDIRNTVDHRLLGEFEINSVWKAMETAMSCIPATSIQRPPMSHVLTELKECLMMETNREKTWKMEETQETKSGNSIEFIPGGLETETGPEAR